MGKDQSAVIKLIDSLEKKKLIKRVVDVNDRRKNFLTITERGEKVMQQYMEIEHELINELQQGLPDYLIDRLRLSECKTKIIYLYNDCTCQLIFLQLHHL